VVPVLQITIANFVGGVVMVAYLRPARRAATEDRENVRAQLPILAPGLVAGLVGATIVATWFLAADLVAGSPLRTPTVLGSALVLGAGSPEEVRLNAGVIITYSLLHLATFAGVGIAFVWLTRQIRSAPDLAVRGLGALLFLEVLFLGTAGMASDWVVEELGWATVLVANALAVAGMGSWIWHRDQFRAS